MKYLLALHVTGSNVDAATVKGASLGVSGDYSSLELKGTSSTLGGGFIDFGYPNNDFAARIIYSNNDAIMRFAMGGTDTMTMKSGNVGIGMNPTYVLDVAGDLRCSTGFGCNGATPQTAYASGGALAAYATGAFGLDSDAHMAALHALVVNMRAALVANGIMS